jgi:hypothetical protein
MTPEERVELLKQRRASAEQAILVILDSEMEKTMTPEERARDLLGDWKNELGCDMHVVMVAAVTGAITAAVAQERGRIAALVEQNVGDMKMLAPWMGQALLNWIFEQEPT